MHVASLHIHPLKSCLPLDVDALLITPRGPEGDRRWLLVDDDGRFVTARQHPRLAGIRAMPTATGLHLQARGHPAFDVPTPPARAPRVPVVIWGDRVDAQRCDPAADAWLSCALGFPVRLVHMDAAAHRPVDRAYAAAGDEVSFADGYPLLVISQAALDGLNARLQRPVPMARFRPNLVVAGAMAHAEDRWRRVRIGAVEFEAVKPCTRCVFTTLDLDSLARDPDGEPLRTLAGYRRAPAGSSVTGVTFGMNLIPRGTGRVRRGDGIVVID
jgi:hypothetical protein